MSKIFSYGGSYRSYVGLLDLCPIAAVAYSPRRLRAAYTGPPYRYRNTSNNAEGDIAFDSNNEVSPSSIITITSVGSSGFSIGQQMTFSAFYSSASFVMTILYDQSGNGNHAFNTSGPNQRRAGTAGVFVTIGSNNKPASTNGTGLGNLFLTNSIPFTADMFTLNVIHRPSLSTNNINFASPTLGYDAWWYIDNVLYTNGFGGGNFGVNNAIGDFVITTERDATNSRVFINGTQQGSTQSSPAITSQVFSTLYNRAGDFLTSNSPKGAEHIVWCNNKISDRALIINNARAYYGI
jgi:hypothetical protein